MREQMTVFANVMQIIREDDEYAIYVEQASAEFGVYCFRKPALAYHRHHARTCLRADNRLRKYSKRGATRRHVTSD